MNSNKYKTQNNNLIKYYLNKKILLYIISYSLLNY